MCDVLVLHSALQGRSSPAAATRLLATLPYAYRLDLERRGESARLASLAGIALLLEAVRRLRGEPADLRNLRMFAGSRPALERGPSFSIAHSATRVAIAVSECCEPGLDVEDAGAAGRTQPELARWTAVEATLKAMGVGLRHVREVDLDDDLEGSQFRGTRLHLYAVRLVDGCVARLASPTRVAVVTVEEVASPW